MKFKEEFKEDDIRFVETIFRRVIIDNNYEFYSKTLMDKKELLKYNFLNIRYNFSFLTNFSHWYKLYKISRRAFLDKFVKCFSYPFIKDIERRGMIKKAFKFNSYDKLNRK